MLGPRSDMASGFIPAIASRRELKFLHDAFMRMSGPAPLEKWNQAIYNRLVIGLLHHAPELLAEKEKSDGPE